MRSLLFNVAALIVVGTAACARAEQAKLAEPISWTEHPDYQPYLAEWQKRPEYRPAAANKKKANPKKGARKKAG